MYMDTFLSHHLQTVCRYRIILNRSWFLDNQLNFKIDLGVERSPKVCLILTLPEKGSFLQSPCHQSPLKISKDGEFVFPRKSLLNYYTWEWENCNKKDIFLYLATNVSVRKWGKIRSRADFGKLLGSIYQTYTDQMTQQFQSQGYTQQKCVFLCTERHVQEDI